MPSRFSPYVNTPYRAQDRESDYYNQGMISQYGQEPLPIPIGNADWNHQMTPIESARYSLLQQLLWRQERPSIYEETYTDMAGKTHTVTKRAPWANENDAAVAQILGQLDAMDQSELNQLKSRASREMMERNRRLDAIGFRSLLEETDPVARHAYFQVMSGMPSNGLYLARTAEIDAEGNVAAAAYRYQGAKLAADARRYAADNSSKSRIQVEKVRAITKQADRLLQLRQRYTDMLPRANKRDRSRLEENITKIERQLQELQGALKMIGAEIRPDDMEASGALFDDDMIMGQDNSVWEE